MLGVPFKLQSRAKQIKVMPRIKRGANPIGTRGAIPSPIGKSIERPIYRVYMVTGNEAGHPTENNPIIWAAYDGGPSTFAPTPFIRLPLSAWASDSLPVSQEDVFWEDDKMFQL